MRNLSDATTTCQTAFAEASNETDDRHRVDDATQSRHEAPAHAFGSRVRASRPT